MNWKGFTIFLIAYLLINASFACISFNMISKYDQDMIKLQNMPNVAKGIIK